MNREAGVGLKTLGPSYDSGKGKPGRERLAAGAEVQFRLLVDSLEHYAIFAMDEDGRILTWNSGAQRLMGYEAEEIIGMNSSLFFTAEDVQNGMPERILEEALQRGRYEEESWRVRKDASRFWAKAITVALRDEAGRLKGFGRVTRDLTMEKAAEEELRKANAALDSKVKERTSQLERANAALNAEILERLLADKKLEDSLGQLRALSARIQLVREQERKRISREVHDTMGQALTAIKMDLAWLAQKLARGEERVHKRAESALRLVDETIQTVRHVAEELRPGVLDDLGLAAAVEWQAQEFQAQTGIASELHMPMEDIELDSERATAVFRIFQETLSNVVQHSRATRIVVRLEKSASDVTLEVQDNGKGISAEQISNPRSLGLLGMRERAFLLGGFFAIFGEEGQGTKVVVQIPTGVPPGATGA